jgi:hypothetical protein
MTKLVLAPSRRYFGFGNRNDYVVLDGGRVIGRIFRSPQAPENQPWLWTITAPAHPHSVHNKGYSATREQAMADFKARWLVRLSPSTLTVRMNLLRHIPNLL